MKQAAVVLLLLAAGAYLGANVCALEGWDEAFRRSLGLFAGGVICLAVDRIVKAQLVARVRDWMFGDEGELLQ